MTCILVPSRSDLLMLLGFSHCSVLISSCCSQGLQLLPGVGRGITRKSGDKITQLGQEVLPHSLVMGT